MKGKLEIQKISLLLSATGLAFLLLLAPCKVRNFIQAELGVPQTEVSNKSKTSFANSTCKSVSISEAFQVSTKPLIPQQQFFISTSCALNFSMDLASRSNYPAVIKRLSSFSIPLYIFYQRLKVYCTIFCLQ